MRIAILASGKGSNLRVILKQAALGRLAAEPCLVLSNKPDSGAVRLARAARVPVWAESQVGIDRQEYDGELIRQIRQAGAEAVILAGYMRLLSSEFIRAFRGRILNIHPSLLPSFPGLAGCRDALDYSVRIAGCTVHFVEEAMDGGAIVIQAALPVSPADNEATLMPAIHALEHRIYPQAIQWLAQGRLVQRGRNVQLLPRAEDIPAPKRPCQRAVLHAIYQSEAEAEEQAALPGRFITSPELEDF